MNINMMASSASTGGGFSTAAHQGGHNGSLMMLGSGFNHHG